MYTMSVEMTLLRRSHENVTVVLVNTSSARIAFLDVFS